MSTGRRRRRRRFTLAVAGALVALVMAGGRLRATPEIEVPMTGRALDGAVRPVPPAWHLAFSDGFDGQRVAPGRWNDCHWWAVDGGCTIATNNELEWYRPGNVSVSAGRLRLEARPERVEVPDGRRFEYTSGMVTTGPAYSVEGRPTRYTFTYGYVEARLRIPAGAGLWPAFWLLPADEDSTPEIDVLETINDDTTAARFHLHYRQGTAYRSLGHTFRGPDLAQGWHRFAVEWRPHRITWIVDGRARWQVTGDLVPDEPMYLVLNLAVGGDYPGPPDATTVFPAAVRADWIRVWQPPWSTDPSSSADT